MNCRQLRDTDVSFVVHPYLVQFVLLVGYVLTAHLNGQATAESRRLATIEHHPDMQPSA